MKDIGERSDIVATDKIIYTFGDISVVHEIHDGAKVFKHRLVFPDHSASDWTSYEWLVTVEHDGRKFMACMDNWRGLFPEVFEVTEGLAHV